jgi:IS30 family transposase
MIETMREEIRRRLEETQASPEQISGRLKFERLTSISHESIYSVKKYNKCGSKKAGRGLIPGRVDIEERPLVIGRSFYFGKPYHSWERGLNEHTNGVLRQYFPKGTNFATLSQDEVKIVRFKPNNRSRKILNFETPLEVISRLVPDMSPGAFKC